MAIHPGTLTAIRNWKNMEKAPLELQEGAWPCPDSDFSPEKLISDFQPLKPCENEFLLFQVIKLVAIYYDSHKKIIEEICEKIIKKENHRGPESRS